MRFSKLIFSCIFIITFSRINFAHHESVHQYVVKQAYYFLENEKGIIPELKERVGLNFIGAGDDNFPWATGYIGVAAMREDLEDPLWGYGTVFNGWTPSSTHFWDADYGDDVTTPIPFSSNAYNAFYKAKTYLFGGSRILYQTKAIDPELGIIILGYLYSYSSIIDLYKTGRCVTEGYVLLDGSIHLQSPEITYMELEAARKFAVQILGRVAHLLTDMSVPAHAHNDLHPGGDTYEDFMEEHFNDSWYESSELTYWDAKNASRQGPLLDVYNAVQSNDWVRQIRYLFYTTNQIGDRFPSNDSNGDNFYNTNYNDDDYNILNLTQEITHPYNMGMIFPNQINQYSFRFCIRVSIWFIILVC